MEIRSDEIRLFPTSVPAPAPLDAAIQPKAKDERVTEAFAVVAFLALACGGAIALGTRRRNTHALPAAERALLAGHPRRARALLKGRLRQTPLDLDAWFLQGAALLREEAFEALVQTLEPVTRRLDATRRAPLSFLLALGFARLDDRAAALAWLKEAVRDPTYRSRALNDDAFAGFHDDMRFLRAVGDESPAYA